MLCHVFSPKEPVFFELLCTKLLSVQHTSSLHYFSSGMHSEYFGIQTTRELVAHALPLLKSEEAPRKDVPAEDQLDGWEDVWKEVEKVEVFKNWRRYLEAASQS